MALNKKVAVAAFDRQTTFGTLAANRKFGFGLRGGTLIDVGMVQNYEELTLAHRAPPSAYRESFTHVLDFTTRAWPKTVAMLLEGALGARATTGASDPFLHTLTYAQNPNYYTFATRLDTEYHKIRDCRIDQLSFTWEQAAPVEMGVRAMGTVGTLYTTAGDPTTDESSDQSFYPAGGVFQIDTSSSTPVTADITGGTITINNHIEPVRVSRQLEPTDVWPGLFEITVSLKLIPTNTNLWRAAVTGTSGGTAIANAPVYGSFHTLFTITAGTRDLDLTAPRIAFYGDYPDPDPAGGPVEIELTGTVVKPSGATEPFTALVHNDQNSASYTGS